MGKRSKHNKATGTDAAALPTTQAFEDAIVPQTATQVAPEAADAPPGADLAEAAAAIPTTEVKPTLTEEEKKARRSEKRKARRLAKLAAAGKVPMADRPKAPNGTVVPREGGARKFCYDLQVANGFPDCKTLTAIMQAAAKGTAFESRPQRWFARRAWRNVRLYTPATPAPVGAEADES